MSDDIVCARISGSLLEYVALGGDTPKDSEASQAARLAAALAYDHALIQLSLIMGIETGPERFESREPERHRLERALARLGPSWAAFMFAGIEMEVVAA